MFQGRKLVTMLISLLAAILLWLYVVTIIAPELSFSVDDIPISIDGNFVLQERELVITNRDVTTMDLELSTARVNKAKLNRDTIRINADASKIRAPGTYKLPCEVTFPDTVRSSEVDIKGKNVDYVTITVSELKRKTFQIEPNWIGIESMGKDYLFEAENTVLEPEEIEVYGPQEEVEKIAKVVLNYDVSNLTETVIDKAVVQFLDEDGEEIEFSELTDIALPEDSFSEDGKPQISLTLPVYLTREIPLTILFEEGGGVKFENASFELSTPSIRVKGPADKIEELDSTLQDGYLVLGTVNLSDIPDTNELEKTFPLELPAGVFNISAEKIVATIHLTGVSTEKITISDIRLQNVPAGLEPVHTKNVEVTVRGSTEEIRQIKSNSNGIYVLVDLKDYTQPVNITLPGLVVNETHSDISIVEKTVNIDVVLALPTEPDISPEEQ